MKKTELICLLTALAGLLFTAPVFAQDAPNAGVVGNSEFYVLNVPLEKIYAHQRGYVTEYRKNLFGTERLYLPLEWFTRTAKTEGPLKGYIVKIRQGTLPPYLSIYYKNGKTDHVKLYVRDLNHPSWGTIANGVNLDENFNGIEDIKIVY
ncbi:MAG: hypothetical protein LBP37_04455 [Spirochaetaceae bacterium]|jgi:hypothetical protein|nr:hypothetical protein [Spirochaetaceae bacterium]